MEYLLLYKITITSTAQDKIMYVILFIYMMYKVHFMLLQDWSYDRRQLTYMRELGEGHFGKVLLMIAKV